MFKVAQQNSGLTKAQRRALKLEREAQAAAAKGAVFLANQSCTREDFPGLSEQEFQAQWEEYRARHESSLLAELRYQYGERGQIEDRMRKELVRRCGREELAEEFIGLLDCRNREQSELMDVLLMLLRNQELCRGQNAHEEWEELIEPYRGELIRLMRAKREIDRHLEEERRHRAEVEQQVHEKTQLAEKEKQLKEEEIHRREEAEREVAELRKQLARVRQGFFGGEADGGRGAKRYAEAVDGDDDGAKKIREISNPKDKRGK